MIKLLEKENDDSGQKVKEQDAAIKALKTEDEEFKAKSDEQAEKLVSMSKGKDTAIDSLNSRIATLEADKADMGKKLAAIPANTGSESKKAAKFATWPDPYSPTIVVGKSFKNEVVPLDGYFYVSCIFENVTFVYNGSTAVELTKNEFRSFKLISENQAVSGAWALFAVFKDLPGFPGPGYFGASNGQVLEQVQQPTPSKP
jgi:hypothetical protein